MNKKDKNIELKIYELLGIKTFRKAAFKFFYVLFIPFSLDMTKEERYRLIYKTPNNYIMKKGNGLQDLQDFKKCLLFNVGIHSLALFVCIPYFLEIIKGTVSLMATIISLFLAMINIYCIMLQRYNYIRINNVIKKFLPREEAKKDILKEELKKEDSLLAAHTYSIVNKQNKEKSISFQEFLDTATYHELIKYRNYLSNQLAMGQQDFSELEENSFRVPFSKNKSLKLELLPNRNNESAK